MSPTWKPDEAHWCCYSCVCLLAFRTYQNQTGLCVMRRDQEARCVSGRRARMNQWLWSHARGYEGEHLCISAAYPIPACPPCLLGPVAESQRKCFWSQNIVCQNPSSIKKSSSSTPHLLFLPSHERTPALRGSFCNLKHIYKEHVCILPKNRYYGMLFK